MLIMDARNPGPVISREIYGHFSEHLGRCIYEGLWVGEDSVIPNVRGIRSDVVNALRAIGIPVLRWPGGCFADEYHWMDGIGPRELRKRMVNTHWGGVTENNHFGTHEFLDLCEQLCCEPYICGNVGSGSVREMQEWVEYITFGGVSPMADLRRKNGREEPWKLKYFGVGNENWGCGGNMRAEYYADEFRRYNTYVRNFAGNRVFRIACGPGGDDFHWTEVLMRESGRYMDGLSLHHYSLSSDQWENISAATEFSERDWFVMLRNAQKMEELITKHSLIMDQYDPERRVALVVDEWGAWHQCEPGTNPGFLYQQNTMRDALVAAISLNIFNNHCGRVRMANIAQTVNVLQAVALTDGPRMVLTPTYHVFDLYKTHQGARLLPIELASGQYAFEGESLDHVSASASLGGDGVIHVTLCNLDPHHPASLTAAIGGVTVRSITGRVLAAATMNAHNTFEGPEAVHPVAFEGAIVQPGGLAITLPPMSVVALAIKS